MGDLKYTPTSLVSLLGTIGVYSTDKCENDKILMMDARRKVSVWNLASGQIWGECSLEDMTEMYMSPKNFQIIMEATDAI